MAYEIIGIKLASGEEIIGKVKTVTSTIQGLTAQDMFDGSSGKSDLFNPALGNKLPESVILFDVRVLHLQQVSQNQMGLGLAPWVLGNQEGEFQINLKQSALTVYRPSPDIESAYMQQTSSIALAKAGSVPGLK